MSNACSHEARTYRREGPGGGTVRNEVAPPNPVELAAEGVRTLKAFSRRIPLGGGVLAPSLEDKVTGRNVLITGASSGIGKSTALEVGKAGGTVLLVARRQD